MKRITTIVFLLFMFLVSVCCESKKEAMMRHEIDQQKRDERFERRNEENRQWQFTYMRTAKAGRYEIFQHQQFARNTFLLDTMDGRVWVLTQDSDTKKLWWEEIGVENRDTVNVK
ncbi:hypothetical protein ES703_82258 [subsurface metagenome]